MAQQRKNSEGKGREREPDGTTEPSSAPPLPPYLSEGPSDFRGLSLSGPHLQGATAPASAGIQAHNTCSARARHKANGAA